jgi:hypothetical protein
MKFNHFKEFILDYTPYNKLPSSKAYPDEITLTSTIWRELKQLVKFTQKYNYEHAVGIYSIGNDIFITPPHRGTKHNVQINDKISLQYEHKTRDWYTEIVKLNGKVHAEKEIKYKDIPKQPKIEFLFTVHSHPLENPDKKEIHSFFSPTDLNSLLLRMNLCLGLVTRKLWLVCQTKVSKDNFSNQSTQILNNINYRYATQGRIDLEKVKSLPFVFYHAEIANKLTKVT